MSKPVLSRDEMAGLVDAIHCLSQARDLAAAMRAVATCARQLVRAEGVTFVVRDGQYVFAPDEPARRFPVTDEVARWCAQMGESIAIEDVVGDARMPDDVHRPAFAKSMAIVPIRKADPLGAVGVHWAARHRASEAELFIIETLANAVVGPVSNADIHRRLRDAIRAKDELLAALGHELRNPLAPILTAVQLVRLRGDEAIGNELAVIERQASHLGRLVDDLLDASRITRGKVELELEALEVRDVVAKAIEMANPILERRRPHVDVSIPDGTLPILGDFFRLSQALAHVVTNAAKYMKPGGHVWISAARERDLVAIRVRDDGVGIAVDMLPRIFDLFVQDTQALDRAPGGFGLGLAVVRALVTQHGGTVVARSEGRGRGAELTITLPVHVAPAGAANDFDREKSMIRRRRRRVLVVDDNVDAAAMLATAVGLAGYDAKIAHDGLPVMDGYELARRLRALSPDRDLRVFAVTGYGQSEHRARAKAAGFDMHFVKPVDFEKLLVAIDEAVPSR